MDKKFWYFAAVIISMFAVIYWMLLFERTSIAPTDSFSKSCKEDSLQKIINQMEIDLENEQDGWDFKERRYEEILFEYEYGINHIKENYPKAYREFHRIISYRENYSREAERENKKRLQLEK
jgi:hypothetical protein